MQICRYRSLLLETKQESPKKSGEAIRRTIERQRTISATTTVYEEKREKQEELGVGNKCFDLSCQVWPSCLDADRRCSVGFVMV